MTRERQMVRGWSIPDPNTCLLLLGWGGHAPQPHAQGTQCHCGVPPGHPFSPSPSVPPAPWRGHLPGVPPTAPRRMGRGSPLWVKTLLCSLFSKRSPRGYKNSQQALVSLRSLTFFHWEFVYRQP